ncbi:MAG: hypothetical protein JWM27_3682 [Gemmatimonadetes bacterium]|nr:hypothetical protein [Gemmatimonadota bacterium]
MRKLKLELDTLAVESFETLTPPVLEGTVFGNDDATNRGSCVYSCVTSCGLAMDAACTCPVARG